MQGAGSYAALAMLCNTADQSQVWTNVASSRGKALLIPWLRGDRREEATCFAECLQSANPELLAEAFQEMQQPAERLHQRACAKTEVLQRATSLFIRELEPSLVLPVATMLGH